MTLIPMTERYQRPDWVRRLNAMAGSAGGADRMVPLVADHLIDHTRASTGITDAGDLGDGDWEGREPKQWLLKTPGYLLMLDDLFAAYPDARIILTHRDPAKTMPSTVSTVAMIQWLRTDHVDLDLTSLMIGAIFTDGLATVARRRREDSLPDRFGDVRFADLTADPVNAIATAYAGIGRDLTDDHRYTIERYVRDKPRAKHGVHQYTASEWGFDPEVVRTDLADYLDRFGVQLEF